MFNIKHSFTKPLSTSGTDKLICTELNDNFCHGSLTANLVNVHVV